MAWCKASATRRDWHSRHAGAVSTPCHGPCPGTGEFFPRNSGVPHEPHAADGGLIAHAGLARSTLAEGGQAGIGGCAAVAAAIATVLCQREVYLWEPTIHAPASSGSQRAVTLEAQRSAMRRNAAQQGSMRRNHAPCPRHGPQAAPWARSTMAIGCARSRRPKSAQCPAAQPA